MKLFVFFNIAGLTNEYDGDAYFIRDGRVAEVPCFEDIEKFGLLNTLGNLFYFSVVVYSTVGFGEMIPIGPLGKGIMIFEGIIGGLILAILIIALYKKTMDR